MNELTDRLLKLKNKIESAIEENHKLTGKLQTLMEQLQKEYGIDSIENAGKESDNLIKTIAKEEKQLNLEIEKLEMVLLND